LVIHINVSTPKEIVVEGITEEDIIFIYNTLQKVKVSAADHENYFKLLEVCSKLKEMVNYFSSTN